MSAALAPPLPGLAGYPPALQAQVRALLERGELMAHVLARHPRVNEVRTDAALRAHADALKARFLRSADPLHQVRFDASLQRTAQALGTLTMVSRAQGAQLKAKREIRIARVFRDAPADLLDMIVVHELAHLRHREHDKAFYALCCHMQADYHQCEFDARLWLLARERAPVEPSADHADGG